MNHGIFGVEVGRGCLQRFDEDRQAFLRLIGAHRGSSGHTGSFRPVFLTLRLKVSIPGIVGVTIKGIVVHGELRERISEVSGRWDMGLGDPVLFGFFPFSPGNITVVTIVPDHLLPPVRDVGTHGGQPLQGIEDLFLGSAFRPVNNP